MQRLIPTIFLALLTLVPAHSQEHDLSELPRHQTPVPYAGIRNWYVTQNLGATGARAWVYGHTNNTNESRELLIKSIEPGSPADGILQPYDIIVGAAVPPASPPHSWKSAPTVKVFDSDARLSFARAVTWAESDAGQGKLNILRNRNGETEPVTIDLPVMGTYDGGLPMNCPKSQKMVAEAAEFLAAHMPADGYSPGVGDPHNAGFLLATHDPKYLDHVRRSAVRMSLLHTISEAGHETWRWGNTNTFLCEYYLATGDKRVLPTIREYCEVLRDGQCNPGTWGHRAVPDYVPPGYGSVNSTGVICFYSLVLAHQAGITLADEAIRNSIGFYGSYTGRGSLPYGDHPPYHSTTGSGKNAAVALAFHILGAEPATQWFARLCASSNLVNMEGGHSGNYFNQTWSPLGAALTGSENYANFWQRFHSYRDLARRIDGSFICQPYPNKREGDLGSGNYVNRGPMWNTGSFALSYLAGSERLGMLGRTDSVFGANPPAELQTALDHYHARDFAAAAKASTALTKSDNARVAKLAAQLESISKRNIESIDLTLADMQRNLNKGDLYTVKYQLMGIESLLDPQDERLEDFHNHLDSPEIDKILQQGALMDRAIKGVGWEGEKGFNALIPLKRGGGQGFLKQLIRNPEEPYANAAAAILAEGGHNFAKAGEELVTLKTSDQHSAGQVHTLTGEFEISDPSKIDTLFLSMKLANSLKVQLNGTTILDNKFERPDTQTTNLLLKPITSELLVPGKNSLAIEVKPSSKGCEISLRKAN